MLKKERLQRFRRMIIGKKLRFLEVSAAMSNQEVEESRRKELHRNVVNWGGLGLGVEKFRGVQHGLSATLG